MEAVSKLVLAFVMLIVGVALLGQIATSGSDVTTVKTYTDTLSVAAARANLTKGVNETMSFTPLATYPFVGNWKDGYSECQAQTITVTNATGTAYEDPTDYVYTYNANTLTLVNSTNTVAGGNSLLITYDYCPDTYLTQGWSRTSINLVPGLFAIALLGVSVGLFYSLAKDAGII